MTQVFVITTNSGIWGVYASKELADLDASVIEGEDNIQIQECGVVTRISDPDSLLEGYKEGMNG